MALAFADRVRETTTTTGTGTITLAGAVTGYQSFSAIGNGNTTYYTINAGSQWEVGIGTYTASGTTLSRDTVLSSSNAGSLVDFSAGTKDVFAGYPAGKVVIQDASGNVGIGTSSPGVKLDVNGVIRSNAWTFITPNTSTDNALYRASNTGGTIYMGLDNSAGGLSGAAYALSLYHSGAYPIVFSTNATERMRIDSSGSVTANVDIRAPIFYDSANTAYYLDPTGSTSLNVAGNMLAAGNVELGNGANRRVRIGSATNYNYDLQTTGDDFQIIEAGTTPRLTIKYPNGYVGIGTSSPASPLEVYNASGGWIRFGNASGTGEVFADGSATLIGSVSNHPLLFRIGSAEKVRIDTSGNFLIGTSSAYAKLTVAGSDIATNALVSGATRGVRIGANSTYGYIEGVDNTGSASYQPLMLGGSDVRFSTSGVGTERMRIDSSGNVGIGTTAPTYRLHVSTSGVNALGVYRDLDVTSVGAAGQIIEIGARDGSTFTPGASITGVLNNPATTGYLSFETRAAGVMGERMRITSGGNLLLGTTASSGTPYILELNTASDTRIGIKAGNVLTGIIQATTNNFSIATSGASTVTTFSINGSEKMRITSAGDVGIGTSSPGAKLAVDTVGTAGVGFIVQATGLTSSQINMGIGVITAGRPFIGTNTSTNPLEFGVRDATDVIFVTGAAEKMRLTSGGNLLIGTTTSQGKLSVNSATGNVGFNTGTSSSPERGNLWYDTDGTGWKFNIGKRQSGSFTAQMTIQDDGSVGIGTTSPSTILHVAGSSVTEVRVTSSGNLTTGAASLLRFGGSNSATSGYIGYGGTASTIDLWNTLAGSLTFGTSNLERMRIDASGNVGIGTTAPSQRLDVTLSSGSEGGGLAVTNSLAGGYGSGINFYSFRTDGTTKLAAGAIQMSGQANWADATNTSSNMRFYTVANNTLAERMRITAEGNVGIGVTPTAKLHVAGTIQSQSGSSVAQMYSDGGAAYLTSVNAFPLIFLTNGSERMRITSGGYVGIGTSSPNGTLTVFNSATFDARTSGINVHRPSSYGQYGSFAYDGGTTYFSTTYTGGGAGVYGAYVFQAYDSTSTPVTRMAIDYLGNVGIGTSSSYAVLSDRTLFVAGSSYASLNLVCGGAYGGAGMTVDSSTNLQIRNAGAARLTINSTGGITSSDLADAVGYKGLPQNSRTTGYTLALSDMGKHISITTGNITIPANGSVAFPVGAAVTIFNNSGSTQTISITTDTLRQAGTTNTGTRTLAAYGVATVLKVASTTWVISGNVS